MTDDSRSERAALAAVFPHTTLLQCIFHILQALWRWLWDAHHQVLHCHRPTIFKLVQNMVYADNISTLEEAFSVCMNHSIVGLNPHVKCHIQSLFDRRHEWAIALRQELPLHGIHTNNYVEAAFRVLKDKILGRLKVYNAVELAEFLTTSLSRYYSQKLMDVISSRTLSASQRRFPSHWGSTTSCAIKKEDIEHDETNQLFVVCSETNRNLWYQVDMGLGICSCPVGIVGKPCKHQFAISCHFGIGSDRFQDMTETQRLTLYYVATGLKNLPEGFFVPISSQNPIDTEYSNNPSTSTCEDMIMGSKQADTISDDAELGDNTGDWVDDGEIDDYISRMTAEMSCALKEECISDKNTLLYPLTSFYKTFSRIKGSHTSLAAALVSFGDCLVRKGAGRRINVQPTAIARRIASNRGKRSMGYLGRPLAQASKSKGKKRKQKHSLKHCVSKNTSLGRSHSAK